MAFICLGEEMVATLSGETENLGDFFEGFPLVAGLASLFWGEKNHDSREKLGLLY